MPRSRGSAGSTRPSRAAHRVPGKGGSASWSAARMLRSSRSARARTPRRQGDPGGPGAGQFVKLINQILVGIGFSALAEIAALARAAGLDPQTVLAALTGGRADSALFQEFFPKFAAADLTPTGNIANMVKDLTTAAAAARAQKLDLPLTELVLAQNEELVAQGHGQGDNANLMRLYERIGEASDFREIERSHT